MVRGITNIPRLDTWICDQYSPINTFDTIIGSLLSSGTELGSLWHESPDQPTLPPLPRIPSPPKQHLFLCLLLLVLLQLLLLLLVLLLLLLLPLCFWSLVLLRSVEPVWLSVIILHFSRLQTIIASPRDFLSFMIIVLMASPLSLSPSLFLLPFNNSRLTPPRARFQRKYSVVHELPCA